MQKFSKRKVEEKIFQSFSLYRAQNCGADRRLFFTKFVVSHVINCDMSRGVVMEAVWEGL